MRASKRPVVLCVDDEKLVLDSMREQLRRRAEGLTVETADSGAEALELFDELIAEGRDVPVVVSDHIMPNMRGTELLAKIHQRHRATLNILLTGQADAAAVGYVVNHAALYRYIAKPWEEEDLALTVREAVRRYFDEQKLARQHDELERLNRQLRQALDEVEEYKRRLEAENVYLRSEIEHEHNFNEIIGESAALDRALQMVGKVSSADATVLLQGESGTGKELFARAIHQASPRRERPLVKLNCAALPVTLVESELFGHEKGAFSGAHVRRPGRFELADQGTLFLDEIGELPLETQAKLLRVLQEGELERIGGTETLRVDVRIIAATNRDLAGEVSAGRFRQDLYYRLSVFPIDVPPLRERRGDVRMLAEHFTRRLADKLNKPIVSISARSLERLESYHWPGNVRELQNLIERAVILSTTSCLEIEPATAPASPVASPSPSPGAPDAELQTMRQMEVTLITAALERCGWVVGGKRGAARLLDIPESTLRERIRRYGITRRYVS